MAMNWAEFLRTLTWIFAVLFVMAGFSCGMCSADNNYDSWTDANAVRRGHTLLALSFVFIVLAAVLFAIIGGMGWGLTS